MANILILHGWGSSAKKWNSVKNILEKKGHKVFLPDLPGFGENPPLKKPWSIDSYVEWLKSFCEKNDILLYSQEIGAKYDQSKFFLLGHSFGGAIAAKFALKYPQKIDKLFLVANSGIRKKTFRKSFFKKISAVFKVFSFLPFYSFLRKVFYKLFVPKSDYLYFEKEKAMKETYLNVIKEDLSFLFSKISASTVIIWGEKDNIVPVKDAYFINKEIKNSKLVIIPKAGHALEIEVPEILADKILSFIQC